MFECAGCGAPYYLHQNEEDSKKYTCRNYVNACQDKKCKKKYCTTCGFKPFTFADLYRLIRVEKYTPERVRSEYPFLRNLSNRAIYDAVGMTEKLLSRLSGGRKK